MNIFEPTEKDAALGTGHTSARDSVGMKPRDVPDVATRVADARPECVSYRSAPADDPQKVSLAAAARVRFEDAAPIRQPMAYQGQWSKPGYYLMARTGDLVSYESRFEMAHLMLLDRDPSVVAVAPQPFRLHWAEKGKRARTHVPDFFVRFVDGWCLVIDVKGSQRAAEPENAVVFGVTASACAEMRMGFRVAGDIDPVVLVNHRWLSAYRFNDDRVADLGPYILDAASADAPLVKVVGKAGEASGEHPARIKSVLFHLLWANLLHCDLRSPLTGQTVIRTEREEVNHVA